MNTLRIRKARKADAISLSKRLRKADVKEVKAAGHVSVRSALLSPFEFEGVVKAAVTSKGEVQALFGVAALSSESSQGVPWLLVSEDFKKYQRYFVKNIRRVFREIIKDFTYLENYVHADHEEAIHLIKLLGFTVNSFAGNNPKTGEPFHTFGMVNNNV